MERYTRKISDEMFQLADFIFQNAQGNVIIGKSTPTKDTMKGNTMTFFDGKLYFKLVDGTSFSVPATTVS